MSFQKLKIAIIIGSMGGGGAEGQAIHLAHGLRKRGHDVRILLLRAQGPRMKDLRGSGVPHIDLRLPKLRPWHHLRGKPGALLSFLRAWIHLQRFRPHIVHAMMFEAETFAALLYMAFAPGELVTSRYSLGNYKDRSPWKQAVQNATNRIAAAVVANSNVVATDARQREKNIPPRRLGVINYGVDWQRFQTPPGLDIEEQVPALRHADCIGVTVANLLELKGYFDLLEAWSLLVVQHPNAHLLCAGEDRGIGATLVSRARRLGIADRVHFLGYRPDTEVLLHAAHFFVLASHEEGLPNSLLEAMAAGLPIVATDVGGVFEAPLPHKSALPVPPRAPDALAHAMHQLLFDPEMREMMGFINSRIAKNYFSINAFLDRHEKFYKRLAFGRTRDEKRKKEIHQ